MHVLELIEREFSCWEDVKKETEEEAVDSTPGIYINKGSGVKYGFVYRISFTGI